MGINPIIPFKRSSSLEKNNLALTAWGKEENLEKYKEMSVS